MPENIRALIVILGLATPLFWLARKPITELAIAPEDYRLRRNLWLALTAAAFLSHNFWLFLMVATCLLLFTTARDSNRLALYCFLMFAVPPVAASVPGFGLINYLIDLNYLRVLGVATLLPAMFAIRARGDQVPFGRTLTDKALIGYTVLQLALQLTVDTPTNTARNAVIAFSDIFLPYYVASRGLRDLRGFLDTLASFIMACLVMSAIAAFEYVRHWLLYNSLPTALGLPFGMGNYLSRGDSLRAVASTGHALVLGYVIAVGLAFWSFVGRYISSPGWQRLGFLGLVIGLLAPVSRGPWVGALVVLLVVLLLGPDRAKRTGRVLLIAVPVLAVVLVSPMGDKVIDLIPFVGTVDEFNVTYRQQLFDISIEVIKMNPFFGTFDYMQSPLMQTLVQGEGIVDIVNSYISIALTSGLVGLGLFALIFLSAAWRAWQAMRRFDPGSHAYLLGRALLAALAGALVIIATVSNILAVPLVYLLLAGFLVGYATVLERAPAPTAAAQAAAPRAVATYAGAAARPRAPMPPRQPDRRWAE